MKIELTDREIELFKLLLASVAFKQRETVIRVAGGWVRDKVLGQQSVDIDVALDDQSGVEFANGVNEYLTHIGKETRTIAVIQANPDQSKHLETANLRVLGYEIDCVNLRAETYTDTRIPEIRNGTAQEDALRRDFTINALFNNINTRTVEDLTERGLVDLAAGVVRTPISAHITFKDDPLRVLRAVRFASRLNFALDSELAAAASSAEIRAAILEKVSRERVYKECEGCLTKENSRPYLAFQLMSRLGLLDVVLPLRSVLSTYPLTEASARAVGDDLSAFTAQWLDSAMKTMAWVNMLLSMRQMSDYNSAWSIVTSADSGAVFVSADQQAVPKYGVSVKTLFWAAATCFLGHLQVVEKGKSVPLIPVLLRDGLKMENATMKSVQIMAESLGAIHTLLESTPVAIENAGNLLRVCKELWRDCLLLSCASELARGSGTAVTSLSGSEPQQVDGPHSGVKRHCPYPASDTSAPADVDIAGSSQAVGDLNAPIFVDRVLSAEELTVMRKYASLEAAILGMGLDNVWLLKPLMNGSELMKELNLPKGPMVGKVVEQQTLWQIRNPGNEDKAACLAHLRAVISSLT